MRISDLTLTETTDMLYVAGRDFDVVDGTDYKGFVMGKEHHDDGDVSKTDVGVYKFVEDDSFESNGKTFKQRKYKRVCDVTDPATGQMASPYGGDYKSMYKYTVDAIEQGNIKPGTVPMVNTAS
jgi:hypothetical protein